MNTRRRRAKRLAKQKRRTARRNAAAAAAAAAPSPSPTSYQPVAPGAPRRHWTNCEHGNALDHFDSRADVWRAVTGKSDAERLEARRRIEEAYGHLYCDGCGRIDAPLFSYRIQKDGSTVVDMIICPECKEYRDAFWSLWDKDVVPFPWVAVHFGADPYKRMNVTSYMIGRSRNIPDTPAAARLRPLAARLLKSRAETGIPLPNVGGKPHAPPTEPSRTMGQCDSCGKIMQSSERCPMCRANNVWYCAACHAKFEGD